MPSNQNWSELVCCDITNLISLYICQSIKLAITATEIVTCCLQWKLVSRKLTTGSYVANIGSVYNHAVRHVHIWLDWWRQGWEWVCLHGSGRISNVLPPPLEPLLTFTRLWSGCRCLNSLMRSPRVTLSFMTLLVHKKMGTLAQKRRVWDAANSQKCHFLRRRWCKSSRQWRRWTSTDESRCRWYKTCLISLKGLIKQRKIPKRQTVLDQCGWFT